jgi:hypothetical protein
MPGNFFTLVCSGCSAEHEIHTGAGALEPWAGRVWFEPRPGVDGFEGSEELLEGPCPRCGTTITKADTNGILGNWD